MPTVCDFDSERAALSSILPKLGCENCLQFRIAFGAASKIGIVRKREFAIIFLQIVLFAVLAYSLVLVFAGSVAGSLFSFFGFGPNESINTVEVRDYLLLPFMVLGAVMAGWAFMMLLIVRGPLRDGLPWARKFLIQSLSLWFVLDTFMSLVLGYPTHALFNIPFAVALGIPLVLIKNQKP
jgi:hypothetical protein